jgi:hypothetical protein
MAADGTIEGTPTAGRATFTVQATNLATGLSSVPIFRRLEEPNRRDQRLLPHPHHHRLPNMGRRRGSLPVVESHPALDLASFMRLCQP